MHGTHLTFPLENPVLIFSLVLFVILFAPIILNRLRIPPIIGLILAGALIGPNGANLMMRDASIVLFGTVGLLYIMFLAGLEIDMVDFKRNKYKSILFGMFTFLIPMGLGTAAGIYILNFHLYTSILLASMFASHTLIAYPLVSRLGIAKNRAVNITVGGTIITDTLALLVLAVIIGLVQGEVNDEFWIRMGISITLFAIVIIFLMPIVLRWFFKKQEDPISQYIFVLGVVFFSAFLAELAGIEAIIGAFLAGLAINRLIPHTSALMNRIDFVGNALFIPFFLIGVGMLIDFRVFFTGPNALIVALVMTVVATFSKYSAAFLTKLAFKFTKHEFMLMFGLSNAQAAATLAAVLVGFNIVIEVLPDGTPLRLLNEDVLNGTILMILVTCSISSFAVNRSAHEIALLEAEFDTNENELFKGQDGRFLLPVSHTETIDIQVNLAALFKKHKHKTDFVTLNIQTEKEPATNGRKLIEKVQKEGAALNLSIHPVLRHDISVTNGLLNVIKEYNISDLIIGVFNNNDFSKTFQSNVIETVVSKTSINLFIARCLQPLSTIKKMVIIVPEKAEYETGFIKWIQRIDSLSKQLNAELLFYTSPGTLEHLEKVVNSLNNNLQKKYEVLDDWEDFLIISRELEKDDLLFVLSARKNTLSYNKLFDKLPRQLSKYFSKHNVIVVYPEQYNESELEIRRLDGSIDDLIEENIRRIDSIGKYFRRFIKGK